MDNSTINNQGRNQPFNPMMSPNTGYNMGNMDLNQVLMMQKMYDMNNNNMYHLNYDRGGQYTNELEAMKNLDSEQLETYIKRMKDKIYNQMNITNFDPLFLQTLNSQQLDALIRKISLELSGLNNIVTENVKKTDAAIPYFNNILNLQNNSPISVNNNDLTDSIVIPSNQMAHIYHEDTVNTNNVVVVDDYEKHNKNITQEKKGPLVKYTDILIKSQDYDEPSNYNDYMVEFDQNNPYRNVVSFQLVNLKVPKTSNTVTHHSNKFRYMIDEQEMK